MVPKDLVSFTFDGAEIVPRYFLERDHVWLRALVDEYVRFEGRPRRELVERLADPLPMRAPADKVRIARHVLDRAWRFKVQSVVEPRRARSLLFGEACRTWDRDAAIEKASARAEVTPSQLLEGLFADLPYERAIRSPDAIPNAAELAQEANLALVAGMLKSAVAISVAASSDLRAVVRQAKLQGLLCVVRQPAGSDRRRSESAVSPQCLPRGTRLEISGPYALFRRTLIYGRALASIVPFAARCQDMTLRAACALEAGALPLGSRLTAGALPFGSRLTAGALPLGSRLTAGETRTLVIRSGDPLFPAAASKRHDSKLEERFFRDFAKVAPDWDIAREPVAVPVAVPVDGTIIFPDFELRHRRDHERRWLVEIAGFWTPEYIARKLRHLRAANLDRFILCIDEARNCAAEDLPEHARIVRYKRRIDPSELLRIIEPT